jgi:hypothetical protein
VGILKVERNIIHHGLIHSAEEEALTQQDDDCRTAIDSNYSFVSYSRQKAVENLRFNLPGIIGILANLHSTITNKISEEVPMVSMLITSGELQAKYAPPPEIGISRNIVPTEEVNTPM